MKERTPPVYYKDLPWSTRAFLFPGKLANGREEEWKVSERKLQVWSIPVGAGIFLLSVWLSAFLRDSLVALGPLLVFLSLWANFGAVWWSTRQGKRRIRRLREKRLRERLPHKAFPELMKWQKNDVIDTGDERTWHYDGISRKGILQLVGPNLQEFKNVDLYKNASTVANLSLESRNAEEVRDEDARIYQEALSSTSALSSASALSSTRRESENPKENENTNGTAPSAGKRPGEELPGEELPGEIPTSK